MLNSASGWNRARPAFSVQHEGGRRAPPDAPVRLLVQTPFEYGRRDVQMARDGGEARAMELARRHYGERNLATRTAAKLCIGRPALESLVLGASRFAIQKRRNPRFSMPACSLLFNLRYLQGMCQELGGRRKLWQAIKEAMMNDE